MKNFWRPLLLILFIFSLSSLAADHQSTIDRLITATTLNQPPSSDPVAQSPGQFFPFQYQLKMIAFLATVTLIPFAVIFYGFLLFMLGFEDLKPLKALCYRVLDSKK